MAEGWRAASLRPVPFFEERQFATEVFLRTVRGYRHVETQIEVTGGLERAPHLSRLEVPLA
jgi:hypothetical protein